MTQEHSGPPPESHPELAAHTEIINNTDSTAASSTVQAFFSTPPEPASMLDWALAYARCGWAVFPVHTPDVRGKCSCRNMDCDRVGKHPRTPHGFKDATTNEDTIGAWWTACPDANIGIATGSTSGVDVLDIENEQKGGVGTLADLEREHGTLPVTPRAISGSGGRHDYFATRSDAPMASRVKFALGLDTRGAGGYIVAPPSRHESGGTYSWAPGLGPGDVALQPASNWLIKLVQEHAENAKASKSSKGTKDKNAAATSTKPALDIDLVVKGVPAGGRDDQLFREACRLRERGLRRDEAEVMILGFAQRCDPPFPVDQALAKVKSAFRYTVEAAKDPEAIEKAREVVADVTKRATKDHGAVVEAEARQALSLIRAVDPPTWARTRQALKKADVNLRALDDCLADNDDQDAPASDKKSQADRLREIGGTADLFHTPDQDAYARVPVGDHHETLKLRSPNFKAWLTRAFFLDEERTPCAQAVTDAINMLAGRACIDGPEIPVFTRLAEHDGKVYLDLTNPRW
ncbi:MAG: bifunctional DNA primase/polymerase, partial [Fimbriimonadaceae bacterium]|nr:bifunctional DNA primase/polymerase [Fimbriimonadaceae bacterium]